MTKEEGFAVSVLLCCEGEHMVLRSSEGEHMVLYGPVKEKERCWHCNISACFCPCASWLETRCCKDSKHSLSLPFSISLLLSNSFSFFFSLPHLSISLYIYYSLYFLSRSPSLHLFNSCLSSLFSDVELCALIWGFQLHHNEVPVNQHQNPLIRIIHVVKGKDQSGKCYQTSSICQINHCHIPSSRLKVAMPPLHDCLYVWESL